MLGVLVSIMGEGKRDFDACHIAGVRDGHLIIANGPPKGSGMRPDVHTTIPLEKVRFAETYDDDDEHEEDTDLEALGLTDTPLPPTRRYSASVVRGNRP